MPTSLSDVAVRVTELLLLLAVLAATTAFGLWRRRTDGRMRAIAGAGTAHGAADPSPGAGAGATAPRVGSPAGVGSPAEAADDSRPLRVAGHEHAPTDHAVVAASHVLTAADLGASLGERATLVQFSSAFCTPCRATRVVLGDIAGMVAGVAHVEIDAEAHLDLVRRVDVTRTPTVLVLDSAGRIRRRATGAPRRADVIGALGEVL